MSWIRQARRSQTSVLSRFPPAEYAIRSVSVELWARGDYRDLWRSRGVAHHDKRMGIGCSMARPCIDREFALDLVSHLDRAVGDCCRNDRTIDHRGRRWLGGTGHR